MNLMKGVPENGNDGFEEGYRAMCNDIKKERERMGGDWAICSALLRRKDRDFVRSELGGDLKIVCLDMRLENQMARMRARHDNTVDNFKAYNLFEPTGDDEPNTSKVMVTPD